MAIHIESLGDFTVKRAVEIAIEQDKDAAMRYIEEARMASILIAMGETHGSGNPLQHLPRMWLNLMR